MATALGHRVLAGLRVRRLVGPVVAHPHAHRWTFITGPGHTLDESVHADLLQLQTFVAHPGDDVVLPSPEDEYLGRWHWVCSPDTLSDLPPQSAVSATTKAMAATTP